jgi:hypothetical protein
MRQLFTFQLPKRKIGYPLRSTELSLEVFTTPTPPTPQLDIAHAGGTKGKRKTCAPLFNGGVSNEK